MAQVIALGVIAMTATFLFLGAAYVLAEYFPRKRPWWREPKRGDWVGRRRL